MHSTIKTISRWLVLFSMIALLGIYSAAVSAHPTASSALLLDVDRSALRLELQMPVDQLAAALEVDPTLLRDEIDAATQQQITNYVISHVSIDASTIHFSPSHFMVSEAVVDEIPNVIARWQLQPITGAMPRQFTLNSDAILHRVKSHRTYVSVRSDFKTGVGADAPENLSVLRAATHTVEIDLTHGSWWHGFQDMIMHGSLHIANGTDHWLFLLCLILPAVAAAGAIQRRAQPLKRSLWQIASLVTAFTLGHSLTLVLATLGWVQLPTRPIEAIVALSIIVAALGVFKRRPTAISNGLALGFGLIHGLAFASELSQRGFELQTQLSALVAFNLGIELMQLIIVAAVLPWLLLLATTRWYRSISSTFGLIAVVLASGWLWERVTAGANPLANLTTIFEQQILWLYAGLASVALVTFGLRTVTPKQAPY